MRGLTVERGDGSILHDISWTVRPGEHWGLLGANGSGKTSLLMALGGYLMPTRGTISVLGRTFGECDWRHLRTKIGIVSSALRQRIEGSESAREVVASGKYAMLNFWGTLSRRDQAESARWLESVGCGSLARRPWAVLSQGERQRVLIARALIASPQLLVLDEPCAGLDPAARERFLDFLEALARKPEAPALLLVTHHVEEIIRPVTHLLLLKEGRVMKAGKKREVLTSRHLSVVFNATMRVRNRAGRPAASLSINRKGVRVEILEAPL